MLRLVTLGRLELQRDGAPPEAVTLQPKRLALLAYLALDADGIYYRRDLLLGLFWPERDHGTARHALRHALYHLRNVLGDGVLASRGAEEVRLAQPVWNDARALEEALRVGQPAEALGLYRGDFLAGVFVDGASSEWEDWVSHTRTRLRTRAAAAAWKVAELAIRAGEVARGLDAAQRAQELDPDDETGLQRLMRWLEQFGRRPAALQVFGDFARRMRGEYCAEPSPATRALAEAMRAPANVAGAAAAVVRRPSCGRASYAWRLRTVARRRAAHAAWQANRVARHRVTRQRVSGPTLDTGSPH